MELYSQQLENSCKKVRCKAILSLSMGWCVSMSLTEVTNENLRKGNFDEHEKSTQQKKMSPFASFVFVHFCFSAVCKPLTMPESSSFYFIVDGVRHHFSSRHDCQRASTKDVL